MQLTKESFPYIVWFLLLLVWHHLSMSLSRRTINVICRVVIVIDLGMFLLTIKLFKFWLLVFYLLVGVYFLREKFGRWTEYTYQRRNLVSSMQDCIVEVGSLMFVFSLTLLSIIK